ncbi:Pentatricopeptide repeat-containing protein [Thalictrum thalictroides]|uniref:Pentatricopeptide repeat-containing protein n=1 Tax=Thalictrum thalictroides TaxID=46969 RepID=A0A7J6V7L9_THATH|nr:Pentatricopeptide repeat-containing protein [Thalictrum thalictroides]
MSDQFKVIVNNQELFLCALDSIRERPKVALRFFKWAEIQPGFKRSEYAFCAILDILVENNLMRSAYWVMEKAVQVDLHGIVDVFIDGHVKPEVSIKLLDLLLWIFTLKGRYLLLEMRERGCNPSDITYNVLINGLSKKGQLDQAKEFIEEMLKVRLKISAYTYNPLIHEYCKEGKFLEAFDGGNGKKRCFSHHSDLIGNMIVAFLLLDELTSKRLIPTVITYNILIDGLCRLGDLEAAQKIKEEMTMCKVLPNIFTCTILVNGFCKMGNLKVAKLFFEEMFNKGLQPVCFAYTTKILGELKLGDPSQAFNLYEEMLAREVPPSLIT